MIDWFLRTFVRTALRLRYRIRVTGIDEIASRGRSRILFLPNHPALIDPVILMAVLGPKFAPRALADKDAIDRFFIRYMAKRVGVRPMPDIERDGRDSQEAVRAALAASIEGLRGGENLLLYPAGRIYRQRLEQLRSASAAQTVMQEVPQARVVLVRTRGLWGSGFGYGRGRAPRVGDVLMPGLRGLLASAIFFAPKRNVTIELVEPADLPRNATRAELNAYLENFYNQDAPPNTYVPYSIWEPARDKTLPEPAASLAAAGDAQVPDSTRQLVVEKLREMSGRQEIADGDRLAHELGLDSLAKVELLVWIEKEFGFGQVPPDALVSVHDVLMAACGEAGGGTAEIAAPAKAWMRSQGHGGRLGLPEGTRIEELFLHMVRRQGGRTLLADTTAGLRTYRDIATAAMVLAPIFRDLPGQYLGIMLPAGVTATVTYISTLLAGKTPVLVNWTTGRRNLLHSLQSLNVQRVITARRLIARLAADGNDLSGLDSGMGVSPMSERDEDVPSSCPAGILPASGKSGGNDEKTTKTTGKMPVEHMGETPMPREEAMPRETPMPREEAMPRTQLVFLEDVGKSISKWTKLRAAMRSRMGMLKFHGLAERSPVAAVLFTSGSETVPKAVPLTHENILADLRAVLAAVHVKDSDRLLGMLPPFHSFGLVVNMVLPLVSGLQTCYWPNPMESAALAAMVEAYRVTLAVGTPTFMGGIARASSPGQLDSLRVAVTGAEKCTPRVQEALARACPTMKILEGYGITECSPIVSVNDDANPIAGTIGKALPGLEWAIVDEGVRSRLGADSTGMLLVRGPTIFGGYLNYSGPSPFVEFEGKQWYRTGDLVRADSEGVLTFVGRLKRFVKLGGEMISLPAVEAVLESAYARETDEGPIVAVTSTPDGEHPELVLFTTLDISREEANRHIQAAGLSPLHNIRRVAKVESIPVLGTGKTDYRKLKAEN